jgi:hypothetical protein
MPLVEAAASRKPSVEIKINRRMIVIAREGLAKISKLALPNV